jgi:hypothetical protein
MKSPSLKAVTEITSLAPQFLVDDLSEAIVYYRVRLCENSFDLGSIDHTTHF